jgi:hypothetical protein
MIIKKKTDIDTFLNEIQVYSQWDGTKYYFTFEDIKNNGVITVMSYPNVDFTFHRKNELFWDLREQPINEVSSFLWKHRKAINNHIRKSESLLSESC